MLLSATPIQGVIVPNGSRIRGHYLSKAVGL